MRRISSHSSRWPSFSVCSSRRSRTPRRHPAPWKQGQPASMATSPLAPIPQPPAPKAAGEIPVDKIKVPPGFKVSLWAHGLSNARVMTWGDKGTLFVCSRTAGNLYAVVDKGGQREVKTLAKGLNLPNGVAFKDGTLYVAEIHRITKMVGIEDRLDNPPAMEVVYDTLPKDVPHGWKYLAFGPDGKLYFNIGAPCNICIPPDTHANISRVNADGSGFEYFAHGVRNSVGFDWHPVTKELYFATHARDWMGEDMPSDRLDVAPRKGLHFGFPFCHQGDTPDPEFGKGRSCGEFAKPVLNTGPHVAGNGVEFYTGSHVPRRVQEPHVPGPARVVEPHAEDRLPGDDGDPHPRRRASVRALRRRVAAGRSTSGAGPCTSSR